LAGKKPVNIYIQSYAQLSLAQLEKTQAISAAQRSIKTANRQPEDSHCQQIANEAQTLLNALTAQAPPVPTKYKQRSYVGWWWTIDKTLLRFWLQRSKESREAAKSALTVWNSSLWVTSRRNCRHRRSKGAPSGVYRVDVATIQQFRGGVCDDERSLQFHPYRNSRHQYRNVGSVDRGSES